jgi:uncharacterized protein (DUF2384 family)
MASLPESGIEAAATASSDPAVRTEEDMMRYRALVARAVDAFGDEVKASRWLSVPSQDLDGQTPLQAVQSRQYDMQVLEPILTRIEHGVYY